MAWLKRHWRKIAGVTCGAASVALLPISPAASVALGTVCGAAFGSDADIGRVIATGVRDAFRKGEARKKTEKD